MARTFNFTDAILLLGAFQGFILSALLFFLRRGNRVQHRLLSAILASFGACILLHALGTEGHKFIVESLATLIAALLYLYTASLTTYAFRFQQRTLLHLLPFLVSVVAVSMLVLRGEEEPGAAATMLTIFTILTASVYIVAADVVLLRHGRVIRENYSALEKINLNWLRFFVIALTLFWLSAGVIDLFFKSTSMDAVWLASCLIVYLIGYFGFVQPQVFTHPVVDSGRQAQAEGQKYAKSSLTPELAEIHLRKLASVMQNERPYLDKEISLATLSEKTGVPLHHLSQIINENLGKNFYDYINAERIEEAKRYLRDVQKDHLNIAAIGFDAGFNSLSAFNAAFRKFAHCTPSHFRKQSATEQLPADKTA